MYSLVIHGVQDLRVTTQDQSKLQPGIGEVLIKVNRLSLCGSDYAIYFGTYAGPSIYPIRFGHEWSGVVVDKGPKTTVSVDATVTGDCSVWCGACPMCSVDKNLCLNIEKYGITRDGYSQQYVVVPEKYLYVAQNNLSSDVLALTEMFAVALRAVNRVKEELKSRNTPVLIIGAGSLGTALYLLLTKHLRQNDVELVDNNPKKIDFMQNLLPGENISFACGSKSESINYSQIFQKARYELIFEAAGTPESFQFAVDSAAPRGTVVTLGMLAASHYELAGVIIKALKIIGSIGGTGAFEEVLSFFSSHQTSVRPLVTGVFECMDAADAFNSVRNKSQNLKTQLVF